MNTVGYRLKHVGDSRFGLFFPEPLKNVDTGEVMPDQEEAVLRTDAEKALIELRASLTNEIEGWKRAASNHAESARQARERIELLEAELAATPDMEDLQVEIANLTSSLEISRQDALKLAETVSAERNNSAAWRKEAVHYLEVLEQERKELTALKSGSRIVRALRILFTGK